MKIILSSFILTAMLSVSGVSFSQSINNFSKLDLSNKITSPSGIETPGKTLQKSLLADSREKSPYLGALFSGVIPGTGEIYSGHYLKAAIFLAIEAGLWTAYAIFQNKGNTQTESFENFANQNWDVYKYGRWLKEQNFPGSDGIDLSSGKEELRRQINVCEAQNFSHQLPPYGDQQYYELIGKYQNFVPGWADADLNVVNRNNYGTYKTTMYTDYSYERQQANDYYDNASTTATVVIFNHLLSAADAAWSVSMFNKSLKVKTGIHLENKYSYYGERKLVPVANVNVTF